MLRRNFNPRWRTFRNLPKSLEFRTSQGFDTPQPPKHATFMTESSMSRLNYGYSTLSGLVGSESEDATVGAFDAIPTPESAKENTISSRKARTASKVISGKIMKSKASGRRISGTKAAAAKKGKRVPLSDKKNEQYAASDTEDVDEFEQQDVTMDGALSGDELEESVIAIKQRKPPSTKANTAKKSEKTAKDTSSRNHDTIQPDSPDAPRIGSRAPAARKKPGQAKHQSPAELKPRNDITQEFQRSAIDIDGYGDVDVDEPALRPIGHYTSVPLAVPESRQNSTQRRRAGSASDTERNEPAVRRRLGEMTKKLENLDLKYRNIREVGIKEAEHNFERLKKQSEESKKGMLPAKLSAASLRLYSCERADCLLENGPCCAKFPIKGVSRPQETG